jgi:hypothetical protein
MSTLAGRCHWLEKGSIESFLSVHKAVYPLLSCNRVHDVLRQDNWSDARDLTPGASRSRTGVVPCLCVSSPLLGVLLVLLDPPVSGNL